MQTENGTNGTGAAAENPNFLAAIINKACEWLKIGDDGKIKNFYIKLIKHINFEITKTKQIISALELNKEINISKIDNAIEELKYQLEQALIEVNVSRTGNPDYIEEFIDNLDAIEDEIKRQETARTNVLNDVNLSDEEKVSYQKEQLVKLENKLNKIKSFK